MNCYCCCFTLFYLGEILFNLLLTRSAFLIEYLFFQKFDSFLAVAVWITNRKLVKKFNSNHKLKGIQMLQIKGVPRLLPWIRRCCVAISKC